MLTEKGGDDAGAHTTSCKVEDMLKIQTTLDVTLARSEAADAVGLNAQAIKETVRNRLAGPPAKANDDATEGTVAPRSPSIVRSKEGRSGSVRYRPDSCPASRSSTCWSTQGTS